MELGSILRLMKESRRGPGEKCRVVLKVCYRSWVIFKSCYICFGPEIMIRTQTNAALVEGTIGKKESRLGRRKGSDS